MSQRRLVSIVFSLLILLLGLAFFWNPGAPKGTAVAWPLGGDFTLQSAGGPVSLKDYRGKVVLLTFGYTFCPDVCPTSLATLAAGLKLLTPEESGRVAAVFASVDPERDTPARLKEYVAFFHPALIGVSGTPQALAAVAKQYGAYYAKQNTGQAGGYVMDHTADTYVIAPDGRLMGRIPHAALPAEVASEIRKHLKS